jgi:hypothetical protein
MPTIQPGGLDVTVDATGVPGTYDATWAGSPRDPTVPADSARRDVRDLPDYGSSSSVA